MGRIEEVMVMVGCLCQRSKKKRVNLDPEDRSGGRCELCAGHPGQMEKWVPYDELLDQIQEDLSRKPDPRSQV